MLQIKEYKVVYQRANGKCWVYVAAHCGLEAEGILRRMIGYDTSAEPIRAYLSKSTK